MRVCMRGWRSAIPRLRRCCAPPIRSAFCALTKFSKPPASRWPTGSNRRTDPILKNLRLAKFVLDLPRPELRARIAARFEAMVEEGGLAEALRLKHLDPALPAAKLLGLRPLIALAEGRMTKEAALEQAIIATRQFAKRQRTWFRNRMADYVWIKPIRKQYYCSNAAKFRLKLLDVGNSRFYGAPR